MGDKVFSVIRVSSSVIGFKNILNVPIDIILLLLSIKLFRLGKLVSSSSI